MLVMVEFCKDKNFFKGSPRGLFVLTAIKGYSECKHSVSSFKLEGKRKRSSKFKVHVAK